MKNYKTSVGVPENHWAEPHKISGRNRKKFWEETISFKKEPHSRPLVTFSFQLNSNQNSYLFGLREHSTHSLDLIGRFPGTTRAR